MAPEDALEDLTPREREVLSLLRRGLTDAAIGERLGISEAGASYHVSEIIGKLGVVDRYEAASWPEPRPWWAKAAAPITFVWRRATALLPGGMLSAAAAAAVALALLGGTGVLATLLIRTHADADRNESALLAGSTKPTDYATFLAVAVESTPTKTPTPPAPTDTPASIATDVPLPAASPTHNPLEGLPQGSRIVGGCILSPDAVEIFPPEAATHGQRVFEAPGERWYLRANDSCVHLLGAVGTPPDYAPETFEPPATPLQF